MWVLEKAGIADVVRLGYSVISDGILPSLVVNLACTQDGTMTLDSSNARKNCHLQVHSHRFIGSVKHMALSPGQVQAR